MNESQFLMTGSSLYVDFTVHSTIRGALGRMQRAGAHPKTGQQLQHPDGLGSNSLHWNTVKGAATPDQVQTSSNSDLN